MTDLLLRFVIDAGATLVAVMVAIVALGVALENLRRNKHDQP